MAPPLRMAIGTGGITGNRSEAWRPDERLRAGCCGEVPTPGFCRWRSRVRRHGLAGVCRDRWGATLPPRKNIAPGPGNRLPPTCMSWVPVAQPLMSACTTSQNRKWVMCCWSLPLPGAWARWCPSWARCRVVVSWESPGTKKSVSWLKDDLGLDEVINYKTENVAERLREVCPNGVDIYFDNVGGEILDTALGQIAHGARIVLCVAPPPNMRVTRTGTGRLTTSTWSTRKRLMQGFLHLQLCASIQGGPSTTGRADRQRRTGLQRGCPRGRRAVARRWPYESGATGEKLRHPVSQAVLR